MNCARCAKKMRTIKNDFNDRKYCKKCHFEREKIFKFNMLCDLYEVPDLKEIY